jgi:hypothetical protein
MKSTRIFLLVLGFLALLAPAGATLSFPLSNWKNYDLNAPQLVFSHS